MESLLDIVSQITKSDRRRDYGHPLDNHIRIGLMWAVIDGDIKGNDPLTVAEKMIALKLARGAYTGKFDNYVDAAGYAVCIDEMLTRVVVLEYCKTKDEAINFLKKADVNLLNEMLIKSINYDNSKKV